MQIAALQGVAAGYDVDAERATLYPDLSGEVSYFKKDLADIIGGEVVDERALLRLNWAFSTGGAQLAKIRQSVYREAATKAKGEDMANQLEREARKAYAEMEASQKSPMSVVIVLISAKSWSNPTENLRRQKPPF